MNNIHKKQPGLYAFLCLWASFSCTSNPYKQGRTLYSFHCESCHMEDGSGLVKLIPSLKESILIRNSPDSLVCLIINGLPLNVLTNQQMPPNTSLNEVELANLINFLQVEHADQEVAVKVDDIKTWLTTCQYDEN
ncbi:MAG: cytochrome c [Saprospiraceae bacterium]